MDKDEKAEQEGNSSDPSAEPPPSDLTYEDARAALELQQATSEAEATGSTKATTEAKEATEVTKATPSSPDAAKQPRARGRPQKGKETGTRWTCPTCDKNLSSRTKKHVCSRTPARSPEPAPSDERRDLASGGGRSPSLGSPSPSDARSDLAPEAPPPLQRSVSASLPAMTLEDVTRLLYGEVRSRRNARRERMNAQMF